MGIFDKFKKGPGEEKNQHGKKFSLTEVHYADQIFVPDNQNPAFEYLSKHYSYNVDYLSNLANQFIDFAKANAEIFAKETTLSQNDHLVHFFFDLYIVLNSGTIENDSDISSVVIDAMHIKYFGPPSQDTATSLLYLWQTEEKCYLSSIFSILRKDDYPKMLACFAHSCVSGENIGASEALEYAKLIMKMIEHFNPTVQKMLEKR
jgi:hypothetical protein